MKTPYLIAAALCIVVASSAQPLKDPARQLRAAEAAKARLAFAASAGYDPYNTDLSDVRKTCFDLLDHSKFKETIAKADAALKQQPFDIDILIAKAAALRGLGETAKADRAREDWVAVVDAILESGDGRGFTTAYRVISVDEEYAILNILHYVVKGQRLVSHDGSAYDVMSVQSKRTNATADYYFNVDLPMRWLNREFSTTRTPAPPSRPAANAK